MNQSRTLSDLSVAELRKVLHIKEQIAILEEQVEAVLGKTPAAAAEPAPVVKRGRGRPKGSRKMSPEARARIAAAQRARWARSRGDKPAKAAAAKPAGKRRGRRKMSPEARERIAAAQRARWAAVRGGSGEAKAAAKPAGKRGGRRKLSPEARERIAAAQRARWAAVRSGAAK